MAKSKTPPPPDDFVERIVDIDVADEMQGSFLEYAYSVIYSRALPDARDGLKPVHRRILYRMAEMGLRPDRGHVKCARVVGDVMGHAAPARRHARSTTRWSGWPSRARCGCRWSTGTATSARSATTTRRRPCATPSAASTPAAMLMTDGLDEDVVDFRPNYDGRRASSPRSCPAALPNLLVNGASRHRRRHGDQHGAAQPRSRSSPPPGT